METEVRVVTDGDIGGFITGYTFLPVTVETVALVETPVLEPVSTTAEPTWKLPVTT